MRGSRGGGYARRWMGRFRGRRKGGGGYQIYSQLTIIREKEEE